MQDQKLEGHDENSIQTSRVVSTIIVGITLLSLGLADLSVGTVYDLCKDKKKLDIPNFLFGNGLVLSFLSVFIIILTVKRYVKTTEETVTLHGFFMTFYVFYMCVLSFFCSLLLSQQSDCIENSVQVPILGLNMFLTFFCFIVMVVHHCRNDDSHLSHQDQYGSSDNDGKTIKLYGNIDRQNMIVHEHVKLDMP